MKNAERILVLGASGMLGNAALRLFATSSTLSVTGTVRSPEAVQLLPAGVRDRVVTGIAVDELQELARLMDKLQPQVVLNCIGVVKQLPAASDPLTSIPINSLLPHRLLRLCKNIGARLVHVSTDCVFSGARGMYRESDFADANDLYGRSKYLGELDDPHAVTLRTSMIGPELRGAHGLLSWFLSQRTRAKGFTRAIFSGLPTVELARVVRDFVITQPALRGVYHVAAEPITKHDLLQLIASTYGCSTTIDPQDEPVIDRSLDATRFRKATGYLAPSWPELIRSMHAFG